MANNAPYYDEGLHVGEIRAHGITKAKTGNAQVVWKVKVLGLPEGDVSFAPHRQQYERSIYMTVTAKTVPFITETLESIGFEGEKISQLDPSHPDPISLVGQQVNLWCKHEVGTDNVLREKWQFSKGPQALELAALSSKEVRELDSLFGKALKRTRPAGANPVTNIHEQEITDDDIPF